ncbi:hypothetical protein [Marinobacterium litorale]|uniref:hypothetical protein n=1 Tax=Marinobacterium litorale TaxID=404770 RepID=UPI00040DD826|nr:hypothetical protein [Marinobacterium litorale]
MINPKETQRLVEHMYSKANINKTVLKAIYDSEELAAMVDQGIKLLEQYMDGEYYESKMKRIAQLWLLDTKEIVEEVLVTIIVIDKPMLFTSVVGQLAGVLNFDNKIEGAKTTAEILAVLSDLGAYELFKTGKYDSIQIQSFFEMDHQLMNFIRQTKYLPPMVCPPEVITSNYDSGYLTKKESMILGWNAFHEGNICLDSINKFNQVPLSLNVELLKTYSEAPKQLLTDPEKQEQWEKFVTDSYVVYRDLVKQGNKFWLTHKVDKRGRTYAQGYHVSSQGNAFRKAILELHDKEVVEGVE